MWSRADVIGLFSNNVVSFSRNVVLSDPLFSLNSVSKPRMLSVRADYVLSSLQVVIVCLETSALGAADMSKFADRLNTFGFGLIQSLQASKQLNLLISPASIEIALGMAYAGTAGETADAMSHTLGLSTTSREAALKDLATLQITLKQPEEGVTRKVANSIWIDQFVHLSKEFSSDLAHTFKATFESLLFSDPATIGRINDWVSRQTEGKISHLLEAPPMPPMVLANAVYFHANC